MKRMLALTLVLCLLLSGCWAVPWALEGLRAWKSSGAPAGAFDPTETPAGEQTSAPTAAPSGELRFSELPYVRPDMDDFQGLVDGLCQEAASSRDADGLLDRLFEYYDAYDEFYTMLSLADIRYSLDLTDEFYAGEYAWLLEQSAQLDKNLHDVYAPLADSPAASRLATLYFGPGFLDDYRREEGEPDVWTEGFTSLLTREANLQAQYYDALEELPPETAWNYYDKARELLGPVLLELVSVRRELAQAAGYPDYESFAWDWYYMRDYTPEEVEGYLEEVRRELVPLYRELWSSNFYWEVYTGTYTPEDCLAYLSSAVENMGGTALEAWALMEARELMDIGPGANKYLGSFEVYLTTFGVPFVFLYPSGDVSDLSALAHEFGHFANDYASEGSYLSADTAELMSQGMEFLAAAYATAPEAAVPKVRRSLMAECLSTFVEQSAYYTFEKELYALENPTLEDVDALYAQVAGEYGFDAVGWEPGEWATVPHFYTQPFYILGYVFSADGALQLYRLESRSAGQGLALYEELLPQWEDYGFVDFLEQNGLESPFGEGHLRELAGCLKEELALRGAGQ